MVKIHTENGAEWYEDDILGNGPVWPNRLRRTEANYEQTLQSILDDLDRLERETRPSGGAKTAKDKDLKAQQALYMASSLVHVVAGWAVDHVSGLAKDNLDPLTYERTDRRREGYKSDQMIRDNHDHEKIGNSERLTLSRDQARRLLVNLLKFNPGAFPPSLQTDAIEAFGHISVGIPDAMFALAPNGSRYNPDVARLQLQVIAIIAYRKALNGTPKERSIDDIVAMFQSFGNKVTSFETIKSWERRLRQKVGDEVVDQYVLAAESSAREVLAAREQRAAGRLVHDDEVLAPGMDDESLRTYVEQYAALPRK